MEKRSVASVVVLTVVTCGIFGLIWMWKTLDYLIAENGDTGLSKTVRFVLCLVEVGWIIFGLQADEQLNAIRAKKGIPAKDQKVLFLVLGIVCAPAMIAIFQNEYNQIAE